jgi:hypothetical protein
MTTLKVASIRDLTGTGGFTLGSGSITTNGSLTVTNLVINGTISGSNGQYLPSLSGNGGRFLTTNGTTPSWTNLTLDSGPVSMQWFNSSATWNRPSGVTKIVVHLVASGGGGSGHGESGGAGGYSTAVINVTSIASISVTINGRGGGTYYSNQGGRGGSASFGPYLSADGGYGANQQQQHAGGIGGAAGVGGGVSGMWSHGGGGDGHDNPNGIGKGGDSFFGGSGAPGHSWQQFNRGHQDHAAWGAGGSSARYQDLGSDGRQGACVVYEFR